MKPKVICHIMGSVDGKVLVDRWSQPYDGQPMTELMRVYAELGASLQTDAWTFGKNTITEIFTEKFQGRTHAKYTSQSVTSVFKVEGSSKRKFIAIDPEADIFYTSNTLRGDDIVVVVGKYASDEYLVFLRKMKISYLVVESISNLEGILRTLNKEFGITSISLQGGGVLNAGMLKQGMIDELSYVVYPGIDGTANSVSIFNYRGDNDQSPMQGQTLQLFDVQQKDMGIVWLRYKVCKKAVD